MTIRKTMVGLKELKAHKAIHGAQFERKNVPAISKTIEYVDNQEAIAAAVGAVELYVRE